MRLLVVDDEPAVRLATRRMLEDVGFEVQEASDGAVALATSRSWKPDVILIDVFMPDKDGLEVIPQLRRELPGSRIVAMSGGGLMDLLPVAKRLGADATLHKPFNQRTALDAIGQKTPPEGPTGDG